MNRLEIKQRFRQENPEFTANSLADSVLNSWCLVGDKEICARARLIVNTGTITAVSGQARYDLNNLTKFYDIDELPGGGVSRVTSTTEKRLRKTTKSELDDNHVSWRVESSGVPKEYYRRGQYLYVRPAPDSTITSFNVDYIATSDDFDDDNKEPYNQLTHLRPFHYGMVLYITMRAKSSRSKPEEAKTAMEELEAYVKWMRKEVGGGKYGPIYLEPVGITPFKERKW